MKFFKNNKKPIVKDSSMNGAKTRLRMTKGKDTLAANGDCGMTQQTNSRNPQKKASRINGLKILSIFLIFILSGYVLFVAIKSVKKSIMLKSEHDGQAVYTIWHIETHEGGGKSRADYLKNIIRTMEKQNEEVLFVFRTIAPEKLESELSVDIPDIVSFGFGVGEVLLPNLVPFDNTYDVRDELLASGSFNKNLYAVPYLMGGYAMFSHSNEASEFHCGTNNYIKPNNIYSSLNLNPVKQESQYEAYKSFANNKKTSLLGTTRDLFRINNLNNIGRTNAMINPISTYTDLIQYLGITKVDDVTTNFLSLAMSNERQASLVDYSLFSTLYNKIYFSGIYESMEEALYTCLIPNAFNE